MGREGHCSPAVQRRRVEGTWRQLAGCYFTAISSMPLYLSHGATPSAAALCCACAVDWRAGVKKKEGKREGRMVGQGWGGHCYLRADVQERVIMKWNRRWNVSAVMRRSGRQEAAASTAAPSCGGEAGQRWKPGCVWQRANTTHGVRERMCVCVSICALIDEMNSGPGKLILAQAALPPLALLLLLLHPVSPPPPVRLPPRLLSSQLKVGHEKSCTRACFPVSMGWGVT